MSLNVYTGRKYVPSGMEVVDRVSAYFDVTVQITECDLVKHVIEEIDESKWFSRYAFQSRFPHMGNVSINNLSSGSKTILCVYYCPDVCFNVRSAASNATDFLFQNIQHGHLLVPYQIDIGDGGCDIIVNGHEHFQDMEDFRRFMDDRVELFDGWNNGRS